MRILLYNPLSLAATDRLLNITKEVKADAYILPAIGIKSPSGIRHHKHALGDKFWVLHFGWSQGKLTNKTAGFSIIFRSVFFPQSSVIRVIEAPVDIAGRGGMVRSRSKRLDITFVAAYVTPVSGNRAQRSHAIACARATTKWCQEVLAALPSRTLPIMGADLNSGFGLDSSGLRWEKGVGEHHLCKPRPGSESRKNGCSRLTLASLTLTKLFLSQHTFIILVLTACLTIFSCLKMNASRAALPSLGKLLGVYSSSLINRFVTMSHCFLPSTTRFAIAFLMTTVRSDGTLIN